MLAFFTGFLVELWLACHAYTVLHRLVLLAALANATYPFVSLAGTILVIEEKTLAGRARLAMWTGLGYAMGSTIFLTFIKGGQ